MALARFWRLLSPRRPPSPKSKRPTVAATPASSERSDVVAKANGTAPSPTQVFLPWLAGAPALTDAPLSVGEQRILGELQNLLTQPTIPDSMLPRAAELVPQLIALLRETQLPLQAIAQRVSKDEMLAAEVMRLASSPFYRAQGDVVDVTQAIRLIGSMGLQTVIARVVLKPIYRGASSAISAEVATRLWEHSEALAQHMAVLAEAAGQAAFDGYLVGMLHNTGWKVALSAMQRAGLEPDTQPSTAYAMALAELVHRLFGLAAQRWSISPVFVAFAEDARLNGLAGGTHAMAAVLQQAQRHCVGEASRLPLK